MSYLKVESGEVTKTIPNIRQEYSNVSFPGGKPNQEFLDLHSLVEVTHVTITHPNDKVENVDPYQDGDKWYTLELGIFTNNIKILEALKRIKPRLCFLLSNNFLVPITKSAFFFS